MITDAHGETLGLERSMPVVPVLALISAVWRRRWLVAIVTALTLIASLLLVAVMPPSYDARMVLAPAATQSNLGSNARGLASLGAAVGINMSNGNDDFEKFQFLMTSSIVAGRLEQGHANQVLSAMFPGQWNPDTQRWREPSGLRAAVGRDLRTVFGLPGWVSPTADTLAEQLKRRVHVNAVPESDLVEVTVSDRNPQFACSLLLWLYTAADEQLRDVTLSNALQERAYVDQRLKSETVLEDRDALGAVLLQLEQKVMMAHATGPYAAIVVDGPSVSNLPDSPKPAWFIVFGILFGLMFGTMAAVVADAIKSHWRS